MVTSAKMPSLTRQRIARPSSKDVSSELGYKLGTADVIEPDNLPKERAVFGCGVVLENVDTGESVRYQLVGPDESSIEEGRISVKSPLGLAIIGREVGEEVLVQAPAGKRTYEIVEIQ